MHKTLALSICLLAACNPDDAPVAAPSPDLAARSSTPEIIAGEMLLGVDATFTVSPAPAGATIDLYVSTTGEGAPDCVTAAPSCLDLAAASLYATALADAAGVATFTIAAADFPTTVEAAWQAVGTDPATGALSVTDPILRHVAIPHASSPVNLVDANTDAGLGVLDTVGNTHTGGMAFVDFNGDLLPDIFLANGTGRENRLFRNDGDGTFTELLGLVDKPLLDLEPAGVNYADVDDDGDYDIFVPVDNPDQMIAVQTQDYAGGPNLLYVNNGDGTFTESAAAAGLVDPRGWRTSDAAFADYDRDGCVDVYLGNWAMSALPAGDNDDRLLRNQCDGTFLDVTAANGTTGLGRDALVVFWFDADLDMWPDLYVANVAHTYALPDYDPRDVFYLNAGGAGFTDETSASPGIGDDAWAAMGMDVGDIDNDGDWDAYITDSYTLDPKPRGNPLYLGDGIGGLSDNVCTAHGACGGYNAWPTNFADFDRDGWIDLWVGTSLATDPDQLFMNRGDGTFAVHQQPAFKGNMARGGTIADYDADGDVDVFIWDQAADSKLYRNDATDANHWVQLRLFGTDSSWDAIGATVRVTTGSTTQMRRVSGRDSAHSQQDPVLHFGLGAFDVIDEIEVSWPSGIIQSFSAVAADDILLVDETLGLIDEELVQGSAIWYSARQVLKVVARTTHGGRTRVSAPAYGDLRYDASKIRHVESFSGVASAPASVEILTDRGASWTLSVTVR